MGISPDVVDRARIASPCAARWEEMEGDDRARRCAVCGLAVFNLVGMSRAEAMDLVWRKLESPDERMCVRLHLRADGTVITRDCPLGWRALRRRTRRLAGRLTGLVAFLLTGWWLGVTRVGADTLDLADVEPYAGVREALRPAKATPAPPGTPIITGCATGPCRSPRIEMGELRIVPGSRS